MRLRGGVVSPEAMIRRRGSAPTADGRRRGSLFRQRPGARTPEQADGAADDAVVYACMYVDAEACQGGTRPGHTDLLACSLLLGDNDAAVFRLVGVPGTNCKVCMRGLGGLSAHSYPDRPFPAPSCNLPALSRRRPLAHQLLARSFLAPGLPLCLVVTAAPAAACCRGRDPPGTPCPLCLVWQAGGEVLIPGRPIPQGVPRPREKIITHTCHYLSSLAHAHAHSHAPPHPFALRPPLSLSRFRSASLFPLLPQLPPPPSPFPFSFFFFTMTASPPHQQQQQLSSSSSSTAAQDASRQQPAAAASTAAQLASAKMTLRNTLRNFPDFPIPGIDFVDIMPLFANPQAHSALVSALEWQIDQSYAHAKPDVIVGLDARGFLFGPGLALRLGVSFATVRKKGKLPGPCVTAEYVKEYGNDYFQMQQDAVREGQKVLIVDDIIATGMSPPSVVTHQTLTMRRWLGEGCGRSCLQAQGPSHWLSLPTRGPRSQRPSAPGRSSHHHSPRRRLMPGPAHPIRTNPLAPTSVSPPCSAP